ncbi:MAG TPA: hypothetical protein VGN26_24335 [Armatimonadota bacterium]|jgi:hypothetical protein
MRGRTRDLLLLLVGAAGGYLFATHGKVRTAALSPNLLRRATHYYNTHQVEVIAGAVMLAVIVYLLTTGKGGGGGRGRR